MGIGDVYVLNKNLDIVYVIDTYKSCIWSNRYVELGDCELYIPANPYLLGILLKDYYLVRLNDDMVCRIKKVELTTDVENGDYIIVTGKDTKDLCDQRIIWDTIGCNGNLETFIRQMVTSSLISPSLQSRTALKPNGDPLITLGTAAGFTDVLTGQVSYKNLGEKIRDYCTKYGWGYKVILNDNILNFVLYKGADRSDSVIFSDDYENLDATTYIQDVTSMGNVALVGGEGEGSARSKNVSGSAEGTDRYEIFVDAKDITHTVAWSDLVALYPTTASGGQGYFATESGQPVYRLNYLNIQIVDEEQLLRLRSKYPSGAVVTIDGIDYYQVSNITIADVPSTSPSSSDNVTLRDVIYDVYLLNRGYEKLADYGEKISFNGTIEPNITFEYKKDYGLGDIVTVENQYGVSASVRIVEVIEVDDDDGYSVQPKFQIIEREG